MALAKAVVYSRNRLTTIDRILVGGEGGSKACSTRSLYSNVSVEYTRLKRRGEGGGTYQLCSDCVGKEPTWRFCVTVVSACGQDMGPVFTPPHVG